MLARLQALESVAAGRSAQPDRIDLWAPAEASRCADLGWHRTWTQTFAHLPFYPRPVFAHRPRLPYLPVHAPCRPGLP